MVDTVRNFAIDWQDWASQQSLSYGEMAVWQSCIEQLADEADMTGELTKELKENGIL